jgi:hypothetical protein
MLDRRLDHFINPPKAQLKRALKEGDFEAIKRFAADTDVEGEPLVDFNNLTHQTAFYYLLKEQPKKNFIELLRFLAQLKNVYGDPVIDFNKGNILSLIITKKIWVGFDISNDQLNAYL